MRKFTKRTILPALPTPVTPPAVPKNRDFAVVVALPGKEALNACLCDINTQEGKFHWHSLLGSVTISSNGIC
jgi:hypothetical protein